MLNVVKGRVTDLRQDSKTRRSHTQSNNVTAGSANNTYTTHQSKFRLGTVPVSLSGAHAQLLEEGEAVAVAGFSVFDQLHGVSFKTENGHIDTGSSGYMSSVVIGAALIILSFFVTPENIGRIAPNFADDFFAPFLTFIKWVVLRLFPAFILFDGLKNLIFVNMLRGVDVGEG